MNNDYLIEDVFNKWVGVLRTEMSDIRYLNKERPELLEHLFSMFKSSNISFEDAKYYRSKAILALTTEEGRRGSGKYRGWKQSVEADYDTILASFYVDVEIKDDLKPVTKAKESEINTQDYYPSNHLVTGWAKDRWKQDWTPAIDKECHLMGGALNIMFQEEVFESNMLSDSNSLPEWSKMS